MAAPAFARRQSATLRRIHLLGRQLRRVLTRPLYGVYERHLEQEVARGMVPAHLGMILDGNRRYARSLGIDARLGHHFGVDRLIEVLDWCAQTGIRHVTLFVFSNDNFSRPPQEVEYLMDLFVKRGPTILKDPRLRSHGVRIRAIGRRDRLPAEVVATIDQLESQTAGNDGMTINIAMAYDGREEIVDAARKHLEQVAEGGGSFAQARERLSVDAISRNLYTAGVPDPDFIIRTSGEQRLSGFCLWQSAYSEYYFTDVLWPEFRRIDFLRCIRSYQGRKRRYGR